MLNQSIPRKRYKAPPTLTDFHFDNNRVKAVMGPFRSGKSVGMVQEIYRQAKDQYPDSQGRRKSRWLITREVGPELKNTTMVTWHDWFPPPYSTVRMTAPMTGTYREKLNDGTIIELDLMFIPLKDANDAKSTLKGTDLTGAWINEASEYADKGVFDVVNGRIGSFPAVKDNGIGNKQTSLIMDFNPPPTNHWLYDLFEKQRPKGFVLYKQPSALRRDPLSGLYRPHEKAENIENLGTGTITIEDGDPFIEAGIYPKGFEYYFGQIAGSSEDKIKVDVMNQYGRVFTGKRVFKNFNDKVHYSEDAIYPRTDVFLGIGQDVGYHNASVFGQMIDGQLVILDEIYEPDMSVEEYVEDVFVPHIRNNFNFVKPSTHKVIIDPNAETPDFGSRLKLAPFDYFEAAGVPIDPASTNDPMQRVEAVDKMLRQIAGGKPKLILGPRCVMLREAFMGGYKFKGVGDGRKPDKKSEYAHIMDALQYLCLYYLEGVGNRRRIKEAYRGGARRRKSRYKFV